MVWDVNVSDGRERAAAHTLEDEDALELVAAVGEDGEATVPCPCRGACRCNCRAFARAFSWVRTKYARF